MRKRKLQYVQKVVQEQLDLLRSSPVRHPTLSQAYVDHLVNRAQAKRRRRIVTDINRRS